MCGPRGWSWSAPIERKLLGYNLDVCAGCPDLGALFAVPPAAQIKDSSAQSVPERDAHRKNLCECMRVCLLNRVRERRGPIHYEEHA